MDEINIPNQNSEPLNAGSQMESQNMSAMEQPKNKHTVLIVAGIIILALITGVTIFYIISLNQTTVEVPTVAPVADLPQPNIEVTSEPSDSLDLIISDLNAVDINGISSSTNSDLGGIDSAL